MYNKKSKKLNEEEYEWRFKSFWKWFESYKEIWRIKIRSLESYPETGTFIPNDAIIVRDKPSTKGNRVATYYPEEEVHYHTVYIGNGYVWLEYTSYSGERRYVPCRTYENGIYGALWGSLS